MVAELWTLDFYYTICGSNRNWQ